MSDLHQDVGRLQGEVGRMAGELDDVKRMVADMHKTISEAKGGWKTLVAVGTLSAALTGAAIKLIAWLKGAA